MPFTCRLALLIKVLGCDGSGGLHVVEIKVSVDSCVDFEQVNCGMLENNE